MNWSSPTSNTASCAASSSVRPSVALAPESGTRNATLTPPASSADAGGWAVTGDSSATGSGAGSGVGGAVATGGGTWTGWTGACTLVSHAASSNDAAAIQPRTVT